MVNGAKDNSGIIVMPDKDEAFEELIPLEEDLSGSSVSADITVRRCPTTYHRRSTYR